MDDDLTLYLDRLRELPFVRELRVLPPRHRSVDGEVEVFTAEGQETFILEHKRTHLSRAVAEHVLHMRAGAPNLLLFCPHVGRELAQLFGSNHLNFVDLAGNCHVEIGERFFAHVEGRRPESKPQSARALRAPSYRVIFALLAKPDLTGATARELADAAGGVSPQTAIDARARLVERGLLVATAHAPKWAPRGWKTALEMFVEGFLSTLAPQLTIGRYRAAARDPDSVEERLRPHLDALGLEWRWGGGAASRRLTGGYYRGDQTVLYVAEASRHLPKRLQLRPDRDGPITLQVLPGPLALTSPAAECVNPLLAYVDLIKEANERARDGAAELYRRYLAPVERAHP